MKGLILKDYVNLKKNLRIFVIFIILYGIMSYTSGDTSFFSSTLTLLFSILTLSVYSYDDMAKWDSYALTMPVSKEDIVMGKYIIMLLLSAFGAAIGILFSLLLHLINNAKYMQAIISSGISASIAIFFFCIILPFITKLGVEKARVIFFAVYMIPFIAIFLISKEVKKGSITIPDKLIELFHIAEKNAGIIIPVVLLIALAVSYWISIQIYRKKEF